MSFLAQLDTELDLFYFSAGLKLPLMLKIMAALWLFNIINWTVCKSAFNRLGILPRTPQGLLGIIFSPILHSDFNHLFFNSLPLFILGLFILAEGWHFFLWVTGFIALLGGVALWVVGRRGNHIGASGLIAGYFGFLLALAYNHPTIISVLLGGVSIYYFSSIFLSLFPTEELVSWEGHLTGFLAGLVTALIMTTYFSVRL